MPGGYFLYETGIEPGELSLGEAQGSDQQQNGGDGQQGGQDAQAGSAAGLGLVWIDYFHHSPWCGFEIGCQYKYSIFWITFQCLLSRNLSKNGAPYHIDRGMIFTKHVAAQPLGGGGIQKMVKPFFEYPFPEKPGSCQSDFS